MTGNNLNSNVGIEVTRTDETLKAYLNRGYQLWQRAAIDQAVDSSLMKSNNFLEWLEKKLPSCKPSTRRQYIASSRRLLEVMSSQALNDSERNEINSSLQYSINMKSDQYNSEEIVKKNWRGFTSSQKSKKFTDKEIELFFEEVKDKIKWKWSKQAAVFVFANRLVGLRPCEWRDAMLIDTENKILVVRNGKNTNGRANGETRHLNISKFSNANLTLIKKQLKLVDQYKKSDKEWLNYYNGIRQATYRIERQIHGHGKKKYASLYSTRHQFSANAKLAGNTLDEIAALMGHATDETASEHYGRKKHGIRGFNVTPDQSEVATVRIKYTKKMKQRLKP